MEKWISARESPSGFNLGQSLLKCL